jgi:hypothetical protein
MARMRERDRLAQDRQQLSNDLSKLEKNMRDSARQLAPNQPGAAKQLRDALTEMDNSDLDNHTQRSADWLRRGINPNANGTEAQIAEGLDKLKQQLQQAQQAMNDEKGGQRGPGHEADQADQTAALDAVERLRNRVESMKRARDGSQGGNPQNARAGNSPSGQPNGQQSGQGQWQANQPLSRGGAQAGGNNDPRGGNAQSSPGDVGGARLPTARSGATSTPAITHTARAASHRPTIHPPVMPTLSKRSSRSSAN